ncbi:MAG TPA: DUF1015 domain-containing protein, partial [Dictyoglomaceae bacterium]|nr:DUF1015 domain-containing protein [Dictyoglomaceae bacterium]
MVELLPFKALRYNSNLPLEKLVAPSYDVISKEERGKYLNSHQYNITHLTLGDRIPPDYDAISELLNGWIKEKILVQEDSAFYLYKQKYEWKGRKKNSYGLLGVLALKPLGREILPHEHTFSGPKEDRLEILRHTRANLEPIWGIYEDKGSILGSLWSNVERENAIIKVISWDEREHTLWKITDDGVIETIKKFFDDKKILIADGHHRYEASWLFYNETKDEKTKYILILLTDLYDPGIKILPTHRIVRKDIDISLEDIEKNFHIILESKKYDELTLIFDSSVPFIYYWCKNKLYKLIPKESYLSQKGEGSNLWWILPTTLLQKGVWGGILGKTENELQQDGYIRFSHDINEVKNLLHTGEYSSSFVLPSIPIEIIYALAINNERLP